VALLTSAVAVSAERVTAAMPFDTPENSPANPLLDFSGLPRFAQVRPEHVAPAIEQLLAEARACIEQLSRADAPLGWEALVEPIDDVTEKLGRAWGVVAHLNAVCDTSELRAQYNAVQPKITAFWTELSQNLALYARYRELAAQPERASWSTARRRVLDNELRDFRLGGADLGAEQKQRFAAIRSRTAQLSTRFAENTLDSTDAFALIVEDEARLAGLPADALQLARESAEADGKAGFKLTLQAPSYVPAMQYLDDRALREQLYRASCTRASEYGRGEWDNTGPMIELLQLRREQAQLLGYGDYVELSLVRKMARSADEVRAFLLDLARRAQLLHVAFRVGSRAFAAAELRLPQLAAWDLAYASEKLRQARYAYSEQELKQYFPEPRVLAGLFEVIETLFGVAIRADNAPVWHPDARVYRVESKRGELLGQFFIDLYARDHKQGGAWMDDVRSRRRLAADVQTPVATLTCNFSRPAGGKPALFTHDDVLTLFHEFGHGLHLLLTQVDELGVSGLHGVEWDAVELPSQFMENFCWEWNTLQRLTSHVDSGAPLPRALYDKMIAARNFQSGMQMVRQIEFALFDLAVHAEPAPEKLDRARLIEIAAQVRRDVAVVFPPEYYRGAWTFTHIFSGGYAAGYYSYKWAEVLSADAFAAFEEAGATLDPTLGARFRDEVLAVGGSRSAADSFAAFRGRAPSIDALLRHHGLSESPH
jgi:oligopeptidase A